MKKNAVAAGILALAVLMGGFALYKTQTAQKAPASAGTAYTDEPAVAASTTPTDTETAATTDEKVTTDSKSTTTSTNTKTSGTTPATPAKSVPETHTVTKGETLRDIAKHYYGDPVYSGDIERVNNLNDPNNIPVGKVLNLPRPNELNSTPAATYEAGKAPDDATGGMPTH